MDIYEFIKDKSLQLHDGRGCIVYLTLDTSRSDNILTAVVKVCYAPAKKDSAEYIKIELLTLPNSECTIVQTFPLTHTELNGRREITNISAFNLASWVLKYKHKSERLCTWQVQARFNITPSVQLLEMNVSVCRKVNRIKKFLIVDNYYEWNPIQCPF